MIIWPSRDQRARISATFAEWFSSRRWSLNDQIVALASAVLAVSVFLPWYKATVRVGNLSAFLIQPRGTASGIIVHEYLWAVFGLGLVQCVVLVACHAPGRRRPLTIPGYRPALLVTSAISFVLAVIAFALRPGTWYGQNAPGGEFKIGIGWDYGAPIAVVAALACLVVAWTVLRDPALRDPALRDPAAGQSGVSY